MTILLAMLGTLIVAVGGIVWALGKSKSKTPRPHKNPAIRRVIIVAWIYAVVPSATQVTLSGRPDAYEVDTVVVYAPLASAVGQSLQVTLLALLFLVTIQYIARPPERIDGERAIPAVLALSPWGLLALLVVAYDQVAINPLLAIYPLIVVAIAHGRPSVQDFAVLGRLAVITATASVIVGLVFPELATIGAGPLADKTIFGEGALAGPFPHSNTLGVFLAVMLPAVALLPSRRSQVYGVFVVAIAITWTASRTSWLAGGLVLLAMFGFAVLRAAKGRRILVWLSTVATAIVVIYVPLSTDSPLAFTERGRIWLATLARWETDLWFGSGPAAFSEPGLWAIRFQGAFHAHNQFMQMVAVGGVAMLAVMAVLLWKSTQRAAAFAAAGERFPYLSLIAFLSVGLFEAPTSFWDPSPQGVMAWLALSALWFTRRAVPTAADPIAPETSSARRQGHPLSSR